MASAQEIKTVTVSVKLNNGTTEQGRVKTTSVSIGALNPTTALPDSANDNIINIVNALSPCLDHTLYSVEKNNKYELSEE